MLLLITFVVWILYWPSELEKIFEKLQNRFKKPSDSLNLISRALVKTEPVTWWYENPFETNLKNSVMFENERNYL